LVDLSIYFKGNLELSDMNKLTLLVELTGNWSREADMYTIRDTVLESHPNFKDKLLVGKRGVKGLDKKEEPVIYLKIRVFMKNTSEFRWRLSPKYGPFDVLYTKMGTFTKEYIKPSALSDDILGKRDSSGDVDEKTSLAQKYHLYIKAKMQAAIDEFYASAP
jgi:hypothetical protein